MRKLVGITALFAGLALLFSAGALPASADPGNGNANANGAANGNKGGNGAANSNAATGGNANAAAGANGGGGTSQAGDPNGANGTVKIHDWPEHKNGSEMANDPKVCQFEIHGFKFDRGQTGRWWIQDHKWGNGDPSKSVLSGTYGPADANGDWTSGPYKLADGHYKLFVEMTHTAGNSGKTVTTYKHKVFKVECAETADKKADDKKADDKKADDKKADDKKADDKKADDENSTNNTDTTTDSTTTVRNIESGNVVIRVETTTFTEAGETIRIVRIFNNDVLVLTFDSRTTGFVVAGFESAPTGAAIIGTGSEIPAGMGLDDTQGPTGVNGAQTAPMGVAGSESTPEAALAGIASLPATSTGAPALGLAGLAITGLGLALLRRQPK